MQTVFGKMMVVSVSGHQKFRGWWRRHMQNNGDGGVLVKLMWNIPDDKASIRSHGSKIRARDHHVCR